jgi:chromate transporter
LTYTKHISLAKFVWIVARDVNRTLGGGLASMELLRRTFTANGLLDDPANAGLVAVSRLTPGTNVLAYCVALGWSLHRWAGALAALIASSLPASLVVCILTVALVRIHEKPAVRMLLAIGVLVATLLVFSSAVVLLRPYVRKSALARSTIIAVVSGALLLADVTPVRILLLSAVLGAAISAPAEQVDAAE